MRPARARRSRALPAQQRDHLLRIPPKRPPLDPQLLRREERLGEDQWSLHGALASHIDRLLREACVRTTIRLQHVGAEVKGVPGLQDMRLRPDGRVLVAPVFVGTNGGFLDATTLPSAGTYTVVVDPQGSDTGAATLTLFDVPASQVDVVPNGVDDRAWRLQIPKYPKLTGGMSSYTADDVREDVVERPADLEEAREQVRRDFPVQFDDQATIVFDKRKIVLRAKQKFLLFYG